MNLYKIGIYVNWTKILLLDNVGKTNQICPFNITICMSRVWIISSYALKSSIWGEHYYRKFVNARYAKMLRIDVSGLITRFLLDCNYFDFYL